jgi:hypothetical protein
VAPVKNDALINGDFYLVVSMTPGHRLGGGGGHWMRFGFSQETGLFTKLCQRTGLKRRPKDNRLLSSSLTLNHGSTHTLALHTPFGSARYNIDVKHRFYRTLFTKLDHNLFDIAIRFYGGRLPPPVNDELVTDNSLCNVVCGKVMDCIHPVPDYVLVKFCLEPNRHLFGGDCDTHEAGLKFSQETKSVTLLWCAAGLCEKAEATRLFMVDATHDRGNIYIFTVTTYFGSSRYAIDMKYYTSRLLPLSTLTADGDFFNVIITVAAYDGSEPTDDDDDSDNHIGSDDDDDIDFGSEDSSGYTDSGDDEM